MSTYPQTNTHTLFLSLCVSLSFCLPHPQNFKNYNRKNLFKFEMRKISYPSISVCLCQDVYVHVHMLVFLGYLITVLASPSFW